MFKNLPKLPHLLLPFLTLLLISSGTLSAQSDLVRWNNSNLTPSYVASSSTISASNILSQNINISNISYDNLQNWFQTSGWPNGNDNGGGIGDASKYIEFSISSQPGYKIDLDKFNFRYQAQGITQNFQVRYSKDNFATYTTSIGNTVIPNDNWTSTSANISLLNPVMPGQTVKIRIYAYNTWNNFNIKRIQDSNQPNNFSETPTITGTVSPAVTGDPTDLKITKTMNNYTPHVGDNVVYTILVENIGSNTASGTSVLDQLPAGFLYVNSAPTIGSYNSGTGIWTIGSLSNSTTATLQITAQMQSSGPYTNTATVSHYGTDSVSSNNSDNVTPSNVCGNCNHTLPNGAGHIDVLSGQTYCLHSGTFTGTINIQAGGTVCIASGANFNPSGGSNLFNGNIINRGNMTFDMFNNATHTVNIVNNGNFNSSSIQNFAGSILNNGTMNITSGGYVQFLTGASLQNHNNINLFNAHFTNATVHNYGNLSVNNGLNVTGGYWENHFDAEISINMNSSGSTMTFNGDFDNSGLWRFDRIGNLGGLVNNYAHIQVYNAVNNISNETYLTNDGLLEFINIANIEFNGPMLTNNGDIYLTHTSDGNFKMNQAINQVYNNGLISVSGNFEQNAALSTLVNNCRIITKNFMAREGNTTNSGIINATQNVEIHGNSNFRNNTITSRIQALNFDNDGVIRGFGSFYFTGYTDNSGGEIYGDDASNPINFYDTTLANPSLIFDSDGGSITDNIIRPLSMQQVDFNTYICTAPPTVAGYPPTTEDLNYSSSTPGVVVIPLTGHAFPHSDVNGQQFTLMYNSIRLFEFGNPNNPTNNSTTLVITGKGTFTVNTNNGEITFTPEAGFTNGTVTAEYRMSNRWSGMPPVHPGSRKKITISFNTISSICYKDPNTEPAETFTNTGVSTLSDPSRNWPENVPNGFLALESKNKGFVITRVNNENSITEPKEGMLIYDIQAKCVKLHNGTTWHCIQKKCD